MKRLYAMLFTFRSICLFTLTFLFLIVDLVCLSITAQAASSNDKVDTKAARNTINGSWYDHQTGNYIQPELPPNHDNELRIKARSLGPKAENNWLVELLRRLKDVFSKFIGLLGRLIYYVGLAFLILLVIWAIYYATGIYIQTYRPSVRHANSKTATIDVTRIEELPIEQIQNTTDPLAVCRQLAREGKFDEAIIYLYGYELLALDHARKIHLHKGKTNQMYLRELSTDPGLHSILLPTIQKFELVYFGKRSLSKQSFLEVWNLLEPFHRLLAHTNERLATDPNSVSGRAAGGTT